MNYKIKYAVLIVVALLSTAPISETIISLPTDSGTVFGPRPIYSPGGAIKVIVDDFGWIDYTVTPQQREVIKNSIEDWEAQGIAYGAYYAMQHLETSAKDDPDLRAVALPTTLEGSTGSNFSMARQGYLDYMVDSGKLAIDLGTSYIFMDEAMTTNKLLGATLIVTSCLIGIIFPALRNAKKSPS